MSYLDRLKQLESGEIFHHTPEHEPTEPTKGASDGFVGSIPGAYENTHTANDADETRNKDDLIFQKVTRPIPTEPSKGIDDARWHWIVEMPDRVIEAYFNPDADRAEVLRQYPTATDLEPMPEPPQPVLSSSVPNESDIGKHHGKNTFR